MPHGLEKWCVTFPSWLHDSASRVPRLAPQDPAFPAPDWLWRGKQDYLPLPWQYFVFGSADRPSAICGPPRLTHPPATAENESTRPPLRPRTDPVCATVVGVAMGRKPEAQSQCDRIVHVNRRQCGHRLSGRWCLTKKHCHCGGTSKYVSRWPAAKCLDPRALNRILG